MSNIETGAASVNPLKLRNGTGDLISVRAPQNGVSAYTMEVPPTIGSADQVLTIDSVSSGTAALNWAAESGGSSTTLPVCFMQGPDFTASTNINTKPFPTLPVTVANCGRNFLFTNIVENDPTQQEWNNNT